jgi:hypothetical protein
MTQPGKKECRTSTEGSRRKATPPLAIMHVSDHEKRDHWQDSEVTTCRTVVPLAKYKAAAAIPGPEPKYLRTIIIRDKPFKWCFLLSDKTRVILRLVMHPPHRLSYLPYSNGLARPHWRREGHARERHVESGNYATARVKVPFTSGGTRLQRSNVVALGFHLLHCPLACLFSITDSNA